MRIVVLDGYVANPGDLSWDFLSRFGEVIVYDRTEPGDVVNRLKDAEIVLTNKVVLSAEVISSLPSLRFIGVLATGYNNIDIQAARGRGIIVCNVPAYSSDSVAQTVFALLLEATNRVGAYTSAVKAGEWSKCADFSFTLGPIPELSQMTLGIYGLGNIGQRVAAIAHAFGMRVISPTSKPVDKIPSFVEKVEFDYFLSESDVITLNAPLTMSNKGLFDTSLFCKMKRGVIFINTARGGLVNEVDLAEALRNGSVGAAGIDVLNEEPPRSGSPLLDAPNCFITPHVAWQSVASRRRLLEITGENIDAFLAGQPINMV